MNAAHKEILIRAIKACGDGENFIRGIKQVAFGLLISSRLAVGSNDAVCRAKMGITSQVVLSLDTLTTNCKFSHYTRCFCWSLASVSLCSGAACVLRQPIAAVLTPSGADHRVDYKHAAKQLIT